MRTNIKKCLDSRIILLLLLQWDEESLVLGLIKAFIALEAQSFMHRLLNGLLVNAWTYLTVKHTSIFHVLGSTYITW